MANVTVILSFFVLIWYISLFCQQLFNSSEETERLFILLSFGVINRTDITTDKVWKLVFFLNKNQTENMNATFAAPSFDLKERAKIT